MDEYFQPRSLTEAAHWLAGRPGRMILGGGTSLMPALKKRPPGGPVDLADLSGLKELREQGLKENGDWYLGAGLTLNQLARLERPGQENNPLLKAAALAAGPQIRNQATLGGNLMAPGNTDLAGPLSALGAELLIYGPEGNRRVLFLDFLKALPPRAKCPGPGCGGLKSETCPPLKDLMPYTGSAGIESSGPVAGAALAPGEFIQAVVVPPGSHCWFYARYAAREALDFPLASVSLGIKIKNGRLSDLRLALVGTEGRPRLAETTMKRAIGLAGQDMAEIGDLLKDELASLPGRRPCQEFRHHILLTLAGRLLEEREAACL